MFVLSLSRHYHMYSIVLSYVVFLLKKATNIVPLPPSPPPLSLPPHPDGKKNNTGYLQHFPGCFSSLFVNIIFFHVRSCSDGDVFCSRTLHNDPDHGLKLKGAIASSEN